VTLTIHAQDPDFGCAAWALRAEKEGRELIIPLLLNKPGRPRRIAGPSRRPIVSSPRSSTSRWATKSRTGPSRDCKEKKKKKGPRPTSARPSGARS